MGDPVRDFFDAPPLTEREARRLQDQRRAIARNGAHDETASLTEDEERERSQRPR